MADFDHRTINTRFSGLATSVIIFGVVGGVALVGFETLRQMRRTPKSFIPPFWSRDPKRRNGGSGGVYGQIAKDQSANNESPFNNELNDAVGRREKLTCEDWEMGHLYTARCFHASTPSSPMSRWPLGWALQALKLDDWWYATHTGMDTVVYVRFLKAAFYWVLLQTLTTAPILLAVHLHFAEVSTTGSHDLTDMSQASLSYLVTKTLCPCNATVPGNVVCTNGTFIANSSYSADRCTHIPNEQGRKLLWIHLVLLWFITFSWFFSLFWIAKGSLRIRRQWIGELRRRRLEGAEAQRNFPARKGSTRDEELSTETVAELLPSASSDSAQRKERRDVLAKAHAFEEGEGWRQRTVLVTNLPPNMRDEASIRRYFEEFLRPDDADASTLQDSTSDDPHTSDQEDKTNNGIDGHRTRSADGAAVKATKPDRRSEGHHRSPVQTVVLVRKMNELAAMLTRRQEVLSQLEAAHIKLAQTVLIKVRKHARGLRGDATPPEDKKLEDEVDGTKMQKLLRRLRRNQGLSSTSEEGPGVSTESEEKIRMNQLLPLLGAFVSNERFHTIAESKRGLDASPRTVWEALNDVPRELLDPYQPVTRLSSLFRGQKVPTIDYLLTKLNLLTALVTEMRARPPTSYEATSTAFVTFRDPRQARMVWRELKTQIVVKVRMAPEVKDLDWERLMRTSFTGAIVRGFGVSAFFWFFTIIWVVPVNLLATSLFSVQTLEKPFPVVANFFEAHQQLESFVSVTMPTVIVSLLTMAVPELIFQISKRAQGFVTFSALYDQCLCRYWKFVICNVVIFFCVGSTTVKSVVFQLGATDDSLLSGIAYAFPTAAPFYISYMILGMALHTGFELVGFMIPLIQHLGARKAKTPRIRALKTLPRNFNRYYWLPFHVLILSIVFLFALLNPLVIPFALVYIFVAMTVFKKNFAYQYYRRFNEKEGIVYYVRILRFSLDGLMVAQVVLLVFFSVTRQESAYIGLTAVLLPITVAFKLLATRLWKSQCRAIEDDEANALCGIADFADSVGTVSREDDPEKGLSSLRISQPADARANGRFPTIIAQRKSSSRLVNAWNKVHNSFNANGHDSPSYFAEASARGSNVNALTVTQAVASAPVSKVKNKAGRGIKYAKAQAQVNRPGAAGAYSARESLALSSFPRKVETDREGPLNDDHLEGATAQDLKRFLDSGGEAQTGTDHQRHSSIRFVRKHRASDAPFLSGLESLTSHAPVFEADDVGSIASLGDGEYEEMLSLSRREEAEERRRRAKARRSTSGGVTRSHSQLPSNLGIDGAYDDKRQGKLSDEHDRISKDGEDLPLVRPHASIQWDDTPNNYARYNNPYYSVELDPFLWFPRDPLMLIDLCDSIEWHGPAIVSSQGGSGIVGEWEDDEYDDEGAEEQEEAERVSHMGDSERDGEFHGDLSLLSQSDSFRGDEKIAFSGALAQRMREADELDEVKDPAASLSKNELENYRRALDEDEEVIDEEDEEAGPMVRLSSPQHLQIPHRNASIRSRGSSYLDRRRSRRRMSASSSGRLESDNVPSAGKAHDESYAPGQSPLHLQTPAHPGSSTLRSPSFASRLTANSGNTEQAASHTIPAQSVTMRKALRAEVLQEESIRVLRERTRRRRENATVAGGTPQFRSTSKSHVTSAEETPGSALKSSSSHARFFSQGNEQTGGAGAPSRDQAMPIAARFAALVRTAQAQKSAQDESHLAKVHAGMAEAAAPIALQDVTPARQRSTEDGHGTQGDMTIVQQETEDAKGKAPVRRP